MTVQVMQITDNWRKSSAGWGNSECKCPGVGMHSLCSKISKGDKVAGAEYMKQKVVRYEVRLIMRGQIIWGLVHSRFLSGVMWKTTGGFCTKESNELAKIFSRLFLEVSRIKDKETIIITQAIISQSSYFYGI